MKTIIITDTHFGVRKNNKLWCDKQMQFLDNTIIPLIKKLQKTDEVRVVHCGDVFDSKEALNVLITDRVISKFNEILSLCPLYILAGNHDFYSMTDDSVCSLSLLVDGLKGELYFTPRGFIGNKQRKELLLPFFTTENPDAVEKIFSEIDFKPEIVYCHTDLDRCSAKLKSIFKDCSVISGHIHIPSIHDNFYTIGSTFALDFGDANTPHGCYVMDDNDVEHMVFIENNDSIKFWRLYDSDIFNKEKTSKLGVDDYVELYINKINLLDDLYITKIGDLRKKYRKCEVIANDVVAESAGNAPINFDNYDIQEIISKNIPEQLKEKFKMVVEHIKDISE